MAESRDPSGKLVFVLDDEGQAELLKEAARNVRDHAFRMKRAMDAGELASVLKHAAETLRELRTSLLSPKNYYDLYMQVLDELRHFEAYVEDLHTQGSSMRALYERVQSSGNVLPRLYLLITVGSVFIKSKEAPTTEVLTDLVEMAKGVQHPLRGLFLRHYLLVSVKDKLPDSGSHEGPVDDTISFLLLNLSEMNRLWIRMQHQKAGAAKDKATREKERQELRVLVGTGLVRLSQLDGVTPQVYGAQVLPRLVDIVVGCKDKLAQEYIMDCVIQVFPDELHLQNLAAVLAAVQQLHEAVDTARILITLLERMTKFRASLPDATHMFKAETSPLAQQQAAAFRAIMATVNSVTTRVSTHATVLPLFVALTEFTIKCLAQPAERSHVPFLGDIAYAALKFTRESPPPAEDLKQLLLLLLAELSVPELRGAAAVAELCKCLPWKTTRKTLVLLWTRTLLQRREPIATVQDAELVLELLAPLIRDDPEDMAAAAVTVDPQLEAEQLTKVVHLFISEDLDAVFRMLSAARRAFGQGGVFRIRFTLVPLLFRSLALVRQLHAKTGQDAPVKTGQDALTFTTAPREVLQFAHEMVTALAAKVEQMSVACVSLFLHCALVADGCGLEAIAYEFTAQALIVYEDQIANSREQAKALALLVAALRASTQLSSGNYEVLATKVTQYAARLLKKTDQASMVLHCAHLFWHPVHKDGKRVLECLQRALRIADAASDGTGAASSAKVPLFLDILEAYVYFFEAQTPAVTAQFVSGLFALVKEHLENMEHGATRSESELRYREIRRYVETREMHIDL